MPKKIILTHMLLIVLFLITGCASFDKAPQPQIMEFEVFEDLLAEEAVVVVDVRSLREYMAGHIPGALLIPLNTVEDHISELKLIEKTIVTYCT